MPEVTASTDSITEARGSTLLVGVFEGDDGAELSPDAAKLDGVLDGRLGSFLKGQGFRAKLGEVLVMPSDGIAADSVGVVGLGQKDEAGITRLRQAAASSARSLDVPGTIVTTLHRVVPGGEAEAAVVEGMLLGSYRFDVYRSKPQPRKTEGITLLGASEAGVDRGTIRAAATARAWDLINEPASTLNPTSLAERVKDLAESATSSARCWMRTIWPPGVSAVS